MRDIYTGFKGAFLCILCLGCIILNLTEAQAQSNCTITNLPYTEGFDNGNNPNCWTGNSLDFGCNSVGQGDHACNNLPGASPSSAEINDGGILVSPAFPDLAAGCVKLTFHMALERNFGQSSIDFGVCSDPSGSNFTRLKSFSPPNDQQYRVYTVVIDDISKIGNKQHFAFQDRNTTPEFWLDEFKVEINPAVSGTPRAGFTIADTVFTNGKICVDGSASANAARFRWYYNGRLVSTNKSANIEPNQQVGQNQTISLAVENCSGKVDSVTRSFYLKQTSSKPVADFTANPNVVDPLDEVQFTDLSKNGPTEWEWSFSPNPFGVNVTFPPSGSSGSNCSGIPNSDSTQNLVAQFLLPGKYDVTLIASNQLGSDTLTKKDYIIVREEPKNICAESEGTANYGSIVDNGGEDNDYTNNNSCNFTLNTCKRTILQVEEFDLASGDFLRVYDGNSANGTPLWDTTKFGSQGMTGSKSAIKSRFVGESGSVYVEFESDNSDVSSGFKLNWSTQPLQNVAAPSLSIAGPTTLCPRVEATYQVSNPQNGVTYTWDTAGLNNKGEAATGQMADLTFPYAGTWKVTLTGANCVDTVSVTQSVNVASASNAPSAQFDANNRQPVIGDVVSFTDSATTCTDYYQWEFDKPVNYVSGSRTSAEPEVEFLQQGCYEVTLSVGNSVDTVTKTKTCFIDVKCSPSVGNLREDLGISTFSFADISNNTDIGQSGFTSYYNDPDLTADVERGGTYQLSVSRNTTFNNQDLKVWLDIDGDGQFSSSNEVIVDKNNIGKSYSMMVTIPDTTALGDIRLRAGVNLSGEPIQVCGFNRYGEFEDYKLSVTRDQTPPEFTLNGPDTVMLGACQDPSVVDTGVSAVDAIQGPVSTINRTILVDSSTAGIDSIVYTASDGVGNTAEATRYVRVEKDQTAPQVTLPGPDTVQISVFSSYTDPSAPNVSDQCSGVSGVMVKDMVDTSELGTYSYKYEASDQAGNMKTVSRTVVVVDTTSPDFTLAGNDPYRLDVGENYREAGITGLSDNYWDEEDLKTTIMNGSVVTSRVDTFPVTYTVMDGSGNKTTKQRQVIIEDNVAPTITTEGGLSNEDTVQVPVNEVTDLRGKVEVNDNSRFGVTLNRSGNYFSILDNQGRPKFLGFYDAEWTFSDKSGNTTNLSLVVEVVDNEAPDLTLKPEDRTVTIGSLDTTVYEAFDSAVAVSDNHYVKEKKVDTTTTYFTELLAKRPGPGLYVIRYMATDSAGNSASVSLRINARITGIESAEGEGIELSVYPNPTDGQVVIELDQRIEEGTMSIVDMTGQKIREIGKGSQLMPGTYNVSLKNQSSGIYFLRLRTPDKIYSKELILQQ